MRLLLISFAAALLSPGLPAADAFVSEVKAEAERRATAGEFSGGLLIAKDGKPVYQGAFGYADRERKIPNAPDTKFRFGSMGKMFTAVAAMQLVHAGKLALDAPLGQYLADYPNKAVASVTIEQLLTHTGGTGNIFVPAYFERRLGTREHQDYIDLLGERDLQFTPGEKWDYSNYGMVLLGRVIEVVSGQSYYDYTRTKIFEPLGMRATGNDPEGTPVPNLSTGYTHMGPQPGPPGPLRANTDTLPYRGTAAGGGYSTTDDLLRFMNGLMANRLLDAAHTRLLLKPRIAEPRPGLEQALGFHVRTYPDGGQSIGHGGGAPGMNGELLYFPKSGHLIVVLANQDPPAASAVAEFAVKRLPGN
jgi:D-alanyl-D-alanine carboxypeptidase